MLMVVALARVPVALRTSVMLCAAGSSMRLLLLLANPTLADSLSVMLTRWLLMPEIVGSPVTLDSRKVTVSVGST